MSDRENVRRLTLVLDAIEREEQDFLEVKAEYKKTIQTLKNELSRVRKEAQFGQESLFVESAEGGKSPAAGEAVEAKAKAAAAGGTNANPTPPLPSAEDLDAHESDNEQRRRNSGDPA